MESLQAYSIFGWKGRATELIFYTCYASGSERDNFPNKFDPKIVDS